MYQQDILSNPDIMNTARSKKQVENARYNERKKEQQSTAKRVNFADRIESLENMVHSHPFVQQVIHTKDRVTAIVLYIQEQIEDIQWFCCST